MFSKPKPAGPALAIDLHRLSVQQAKKAVKEAFEDAREAKATDLTIVTGIGNHVNSDGSRGVLFNALPKWLKKSEFSAHIKSIKKDMGAYEIQFNFDDEYSAHLKKLNDEYSFLTPEQLATVIADLQKKADNGETEAQGILGSMNVLGICVKQDIKKGLALLTNAAKNSVGTQAQLGAIYSSNHFPTIKNYKTALAWYQKAAEKNDPDALYALGKMHWLGRGIIKKDAKAIHYLTRGAELGHLGAAHSLGDIYFRGVGNIAKNSTLAEQYYLQAATAGIIDAQVKLAKQYFFGWGIAQDHERAFFWFEKAAATDAVAQYYLARLYLMRPEKGHLFAATVWFKRSADNGDIDARFEVAFGYLTGIGHVKDVYVAVRLLSQLATENHANSIFLLSEVLTIPGSLQDIPRAIKLLITAAELDQIDAQNILIDHYLEKRYAAIITKEIFGKIATQLELAAIAGNDRAQFHLAILHSKGSIRFPKNDKKAFVNFKKSAEQNNVDALTGLGFCYQNGVGTPKNVELAIINFEKAALMGDVIARTNLLYLLQSAASTKSVSEKTMYWLTKAAKDGEASAQACLGQSLVNPANNLNRFEEGNYWLYQAALQNDAIAINYFKKTYSAGFKQSIDQILAAEYILRHNTDIVPEIPALNSNSINSSSAFFNTASSSSNVSNATTNLSEPRL
jgi:TPR repeat protein